MNHKNAEKNFSYFSIYIGFIFLILLEYGSNIDIKISKSYINGMIPAETIFTFIVAFMILIYFEVSKKSYILFIGLSTITLFATKFIECIELMSKGSGLISIYNQAFLSTRYNTLSFIITVGSIYFLYNNKELKRISGQSVCIYSVISFSIGVALYYIDIKFLYGYLSNRGIYWRTIMTIIDLVGIIVLAIVLIKKQKEYKDPMMKFFIASTMFEFFNHVYTFCDLGQRTALIYFADIFYILSISTVIIGICICVKNKYMDAKNIIDNTNIFRTDMLKYYKIIQEMPSIVFILDKRGIIRFTNIAADEFIKENYSEDPVEGKNINDILPNRKNRSLNKINKVIDMEKQWSGESKLIGKDGKNFYFNVFINEFDIDEDTFYLGVMNDNTSYIDMSLQLQKSEKKFRQITDSVHDLICKIDIEGRIDYCSPSYTNLFGGNYEDYKRVPWVHNVVENDVEQVLQDMRLCLEKNKIVTNECKMKSGKNTYIYVNYVINPVEEKDKIDSAIISARNITYKKLAEKELKESERKYSEIFNMCPDMIYVLDSKSLRITDVNPAMCELLGKSKESILNRYLKQVFDDIDYESEVNIIKYLNEGLIVRGHEISFLFYGESRYLEVNYSPLIEDGELTKIICLARDITEKKKMVELKEEHEKDRKKLDEALQYDQLKTEFFANISHELRTPINVIFSVIQVLDLYKNKEDITKMPYDKYSNVLRQNCYRLLRLINNLIDITKIDAGYLKLNCGVYDVIKIVEDITISVVTYAENKGIEVIFDTFVEELYIYCDPDKIERIILNLLSNAIKFTDSNGKISVLVEQIEDNVRIAIKDDGRGIPEDQINIIFERFRQVDKSLAREHEGSGIGLSLVKSLVELHGGTVSAKSILNKGSEFIINLPITRIKEIEETPIIISNEDSRIERINIEFSDIYEIC
ncbi:PAS domain-containing sensor histidine kinase [Clostridium folliculivorans]|uniref:histidine kinase n=1 Tax=Clostridium folliculivorans TaxID=2886038 RepID=A0A9W5Y5R4_9CLOT|nr:PAS domain-containing sensor histidine kinase [Clostridium folliculivorans]GKU27148.1 hypothetical protein CFOLD11_39750 [Clostridium folliculivorans]GKU31765.1 hypothetical protein CFB3_38720 [Clostridium folliculivorans]